MLNTSTDIDVKRLLNSYNEYLPIDGVHDLDISYTWTTEIGIALFELIFQG